MPLLSKKISWIILTTLSIFDNIISYVAVTKYGSREGNPLVAPIVEKYPILYFPIIPFTIVILYILISLIKKIAIMILDKSTYQTEEILERIVLGSAGIFWFVANSSLNIAYVIGYRLPAEVWLKTILTGIFLALVYFYAALVELKKGETIQ